MDNREQLIVVAALGVASSDEVNRHINVMCASNENFKYTKFGDEANEPVADDELTNLYEELRSELEQ